MHEDADRARALALTADILLGATAVLAITGTVLYFTEPGSGDDEQGADVTLGLGPGSAFIEGRF